MRAWEKVKAHPYVTAAATLVAALLGVFESEIRSGLVLFGAWSMNSLASIWGWLLGAHPLPGWAWVIAGTLSAIGLLAIALIVWNAATRGGHESGNGLKSLEFTEMHFKGAFWRWRWELRNNAWIATDIAAFCPECDRNLVHAERIYNVLLFCEGCEDPNRAPYGQPYPGKEITRIPGDEWGRALNHVEREIYYQARIRSERT